MHSVGHYSFSVVARAGYDPVRVRNLWIEKKTQYAYTLYPHHPFSVTLLVAERWKKILQSTPRTPSETHGQLLTHFSYQMATPGEDQRM